MRTVKVELVVEIDDEVMDAWASQQDDLEGEDNLIPFVENEFGWIKASFRDITIKSIEEIK